MIGEVLTLLLGILVILVIIAVNGYFVAQEFAYMSVDRRKLSVQADSGDKSAKRALAVTRRTSFMLSGAQLGITVTGLLVGFVAEPLVGRSLGVLLGGVGIPAAVSITVGTLLALVASTIVQMIFGELFPKNYAIANPEPLAKGLARSTTIYLTACGWLITVFDHAANLLLRVLRIEPVHDVDMSATAQDLERIVSDSRESGDLPDELSYLLDRILDFPHRDVEHAMIPRARVDTVRPETTVGELRTLMAKAHTRYPVVDARGEPVGVAQLADLLGGGVEDNAPVAQIMRPPMVVPTLMRLPDALAQLTRTHNELACVIDEYGGFAGVLTIEDLAEELVGEITDEHDTGATSVLTPDGDNMWLMGGDVHVDEAERAIGHDLPRGDFETVAGLLIAESGALPRVGERVRIALPFDPADLVLDEPIRRRLDVDILEVDRHVPSEVRVSLVEVAAAPETDKKVER
ncbi:hemolysin family protein [Cryobacterium psychrophilum]|uniref:HlyC/CorC family transporter n=1 Tax=Cryobacterium psychrophilum TaxID=41988 RepID=A0A4Y8KSN0_9MICO|nr:hemolysin family protein [Cryobacterium psychrophilum]TDW29773.1 CBS domain containing-hemolysin-like protein [Cryobacterium psychrophilum]TFD81871.1 HlyC/CorC family transporter [Cryobacterium psychrophilum]